MTDRLIYKLEQIKITGAYAIQIFYGHDVGCDDLDMPVMDRPIKITWRPVGVLGEARMLWIGPLRDLLDFDFSDARPQVVSNPPTEEEISSQDQAGFYLWGTDAAIKRLREVWPPCKTE